MTPLALQTQLGELAIEQATPEELPLIMAIIDEAAAWLHAQGITQQGQSPQPPAFVAFIEQQIARGDVYLARVGGDALGAFRFAWSDEELWADDPDGGGYVHSFAVRPRAHGQGIGAAMIAWAKQHVRARGKPYLRLDCWGENEPLKKYYAGLGFTLVKYVTEQDWVCATFQMPVS